MGIDAAPPHPPRRVQPGHRAPCARGDLRGGRHPGGAAFACHGVQAGSAGENGCLGSAIARTENTGVWSSPPHWMYLPSQGLLGHGLVVLEEGGTVDGQLARGIDTAAARLTAVTEDQIRIGRRRGEVAETTARADAGLEGADAGSHRTIRGRGTAPGGVDRAHSVMAEAPRPVDENNRGASIRGHNHVPGTRRSTGAPDVRKHGSQGGAAASEAQRRLDARNAHLTESLRAHAERVSKRDAAGDRPSTPTPADRLAALRRRVAGRGLDTGSGALVRREDRRSALHQATDTAGDAEPESGIGHQGTQTVGTKEVLKMHQSCMEGAEFVSTACVMGPIGGMHSEGSNTVGAAVEAATGKGHVDHAREAAARRVAWHTAARPGTPAESAER